jgi:transcriptional regulator with XRE-family HTH domain
VVSTPGGVDDHAAVGKRIVQARRQLELTQAELAQRIGVSLGTLDRYESGQADASQMLMQIAEATGKPIEWFTPTGSDGSDRHDATRVPTAVGQRIAESRGRRGLTRRELAEAVGVSLGKIERYESGEESPSDVVERIAAALGEPSSWLETGDPSGRADGQPDVTTEIEPGAGTESPMTVAPSKPAATASRSRPPAPPLRIPYEDLPRKTLGYNPKATAELFDQVAEIYQRLWDAHERLRLEHAGVDRRLDTLQAGLAEERRKHAAAAEEAERVQKELDRANASRQALEALLKQSKSQLGVVRTEDSRLPERVSELEAALQQAEERAAEETQRRETSEQELARFRETQRSLADALVWARHTASELAENARRDADTLLENARRQAAELIGEGQREVERLASERSRLENLTSEVQEDLAEFLLGALDRLKQQQVGSTGSEDAGA